MASKPGAIHRRIADLLAQHPEGLTSGQIRALLGLQPHEHSQLDRRRRDLRKWYLLERRRDGKAWVYIIKGTREESTLDRTVSLRIRAAVLNRAHGRCQMCGRTIGQHGVALAVDHKIPVDWGGGNSEDNLWALCEECNAGKKAYFASQDQDLMRELMNHRSVHVRIGELLKRNVDRPVPSALIELVAGQEDRDAELDGVQTH